MSSRGYLWDMIESIGEKINLCSHLNEQIRASENETEKQELKQALEKALYLRRKQMSDLLSRVDNPNPLYHCSFKHALGSFLKDVEVWEATLKEEDFENMKESSDLFAMVCSKYVGMDFETCARCLADKFLVLEHDQKT